MPLSSCQFTWFAGWGLLTLPFASRPGCCALLCSGNPDDTPANESLPSDFGCSFQTKRNSFPAVAKLVAWSHWGPPLLSEPQGGSGIFRRRGNTVILQQAQEISPEARCHCLSPEVKVTRYSMSAREPNVLGNIKKCPGSLQGGMRTVI